MLVTSAILILMTLPVTTHVSSSSSSSSCTNNTAATTMTDLNQREASEETIDVYQNPLVGILANELETTQR
jgi:hypothetical protein